MAFETYDVFHVARHPEVPSRSAVEVLSSGTGYNHDENYLLCNRFEGFTGITPETSAPLGPGWLVNAADGLVFLRDSREKPILQAKKVKAFGFDFDAAEPTLDPAEFDDQVDEIVAMATVMPFVDMVYYSRSKSSSLFRTRTYEHLVCEDQQGNRREYTFEGPKGWFEKQTSMIVSYLATRLTCEQQALTEFVLDGVLGGQTFWQEMRQLLRTKGLRFASADHSVNFASFFGVHGFIPRFLDGPQETMDFLISETGSRLAAAGFSQGESLARCYLYRDGIKMLLPIVEDQPWRGAGQEACKDQKFASLLLERWQPSLQAYKQAFAPYAGTDMELGDQEILEKAARGELLPDA
jgi:hypothetical protein